MTRTPGTYAVLETSEGDIVIRLFEKDAPKTVANFVELAEGKREWTHPATRKKTKDPLYHGTIFHRVIPAFMIQGGDPQGTGFGGPGYQFEDETKGSPHKFDKPGKLAMANAGPNTNGSQFFITVANTDWLTDRYYLFENLRKIPDENIHRLCYDQGNRSLECVSYMEHTIRNRFAILSDLLLGLPIYLTSVGGWANQDKMVRKQGYMDFQWIQTISGQGELITEGQSFESGPGRGMLLFPDISHSYYAIKEPWEVSWVTFNGKYARSILRAFQWERSHILRSPAPNVSCKKWRLSTA